MDATTIATDDPLIVCEEYKLWKKQLPYLYDMIFAHALEWPSLTVEWFPESPRTSTYSVQRLLLGTHTAAENGKQDQNTLMVAEIKIPEPGGHATDQVHEFVPGKVDIKVYINHPGEVNRARIMPQNPKIVATFTVEGAVLIFDLSKHTGKPNVPTVKADSTLREHTEEGYGISWNPLQEGHLLSASFDHRVCFWDVSAGGAEIRPKVVYTKHTDKVLDVAWHLHHESYFGSVSDDGKLMIWDIRETLNDPANTVKAHSTSVNSVAFNPFSEWVLATGSADRTVGLWDLRRLRSPLHSFNHHTDEVHTVQWSPFNETILASSGADRRLNVWDLSRIGEEQTAADKEDGPPELLFIHGGHTSKITDFSWNPNEPWICASVADDNILQIWKMTDSIYNDVECVEYEGILNMNTT